MFQVVGFDCYGALLEGGDRREGEGPALVEAVVGAVEGEEGLPRVGDAGGRRRDAVADRPLWIRRDVGGFRAEVAAGAGEGRQDDLGAQRVAPEVDLAFDPGSVDRPLHRERRREVVRRLVEVEAIDHGHDRTLDRQAPRQGGVVPTHRVRRRPGDHDDQGLFFTCTAATFPDVCLPGDFRKLFAPVAPEVHRRHGAQAFAAYLCCLGPNAQHHGETHTSRCPHPSVVGTFVPSQRRRMREKI
mmetsp:Transcript_14965/g.48847  ORF Transcript_14965/g.48847 Transcript_14965/m.48847 type:complete len:243 (-) Transcript_14965:2-730(-)